MFEYKRPITPGKYEAVHRSLLTGLVSNVGIKSETYEYVGPRGMKFSIFPGSGQFNAKPQWIVAGELVETTKLYARNVARVQPHWIERAADHLVQRTYTEPFWNKDAAEVQSFEKVTLYGLVLVPRRRVHYGPVAPGHARDLFIHHALVLGDWRSDAPFFRHNRSLTEQVQTLEAKARRRDLLADAKDRFAFFASKVPAEAHSGEAFDAWRRGKERNEPKLLWMDWKHVLRGDAGDVTPERYPDVMKVGEAELALTYRFDPEHKGDGVTATIPLAALNQLPPEPFEWLVPGHLRDKVIALMRTLPKPLRVNLIPVPEYAEKAIAAMKAGEGSLLASLGQQLGKFAGMRIEKEDFRPDELPPHLRMNFRIVNDEGKEVVAGRDLAAIRRELRMEAATTFANLPPTQFHKDKVRSWDFGDLPHRIEVRRGGMTLNGYPALVDAGTTVQMRVLDAPEAAAASHRSGVRRLFMVQVGDELKYLAKNACGLEDMVLHYATIGGKDELRDDLMSAIADKALYGEEDAADVRTKEQFVAYSQRAWKRLPVAAKDVIDAVRESLATYQTLKLELAKPVAPLLESAAVDMAGQLRGLVHPGFIALTPWQWLQHLPRYLKGIELRLRKIRNAGLTKDQAGMNALRPLLETYRAKAAKRRQEGITDPRLAEARWLLEELRVQLFAQELKTSTPISAGKVEKFLAEIRVQ